MGVLDRFRLDGKRLFITGGSRGLGREMALAVAEVGADVVLTGRDADSLERTAEEVRRLGRQTFTLQADLAEPAACESVCAQALAQYGPLDILINNLGGRRDPAPIERERPEVVAGIRERTPMQTVGAPEDLGPLAVYLASDAARFMTGAALVIDGGYTLW